VVKPIKLGQKSIAYCAAAILAALALASCGEGPAPEAADAPPLSAHTAALYAAARAEGSVTVYSSLPVNVMNDVASAFRARYGIPAEVWRAGSEEILQRSVAEAQAGRQLADVIETAAPEVEGARRENLLREIDAPVFAELMDGAVVPGRPWVASRLIVFVTAYNTREVAPADAPRAFEDLLDPKWSGKLTIEASDFGWIKGLSQVLGEDNALSLLRNIVSASGINVRDGHGLITNMLASGEVPVTLTAYYEQAAHAAAEGAPIGIAFLDPVIAIPTGIGVFENAPHPNAAQLFMEFFLGEGQEIVAGYDYVPANVTAQHLPEGLNPVLVDMSDYLDEYAKWRDVHRDIFRAGAR
jgi:iron(III) transport system substrate-binding protein